jgi:hypothetical protein
LTSAFQHRGPRIVAGATLLIVFGLTVWGFLSQPALGFGPIAGFGRISAFLVACALVISLGCLVTRRRPLAIAVILGMLIAVCAQGVWPLLVVAAMGVSSIACGTVALRVLRVEVGQFDVISRMLVGGGIFGSVVSLSAHFPVNYFSAYLLGLLVPVVIVRRHLWREMRDWADALWSSDAGTSRDPVEVLLYAVALVHFAFAFLPEVMFDALTLHLLVPGHMATMHRWGFDTSHYVLALIPMLGDWLFAIGYMLGGESAARLVNVGYILVATSLVRELVLWLGGDEKGAKWAMLLLLTTPLTFTESSSLFVESVWTAYLIGGLFWLLKSATNPERQPSGLVIGALMLGFATAAKAQTLTYLPAFTLPLLLCWRTLIAKNGFPHVIRAAACFLAVGAIPYWVAYLISGNPVFPFFNAVFKSPLFPSVNFDNPLFKAGVTWDLPFRMVFSSDKYLEATMGAPGFQWLLLLPLIVVLPVWLKARRAGLLLVVGAMSLVLVFHFQSYLRYIFPLSVLFVALAGYALAQMTVLGPLVRRGMLLAVGVTILLNLMFFGAGVWAYRDLPLFEVFRPTQREALLRERMPIRRAVELVNAMNDERTPVAFFAQPFAAGLKSDALYVNWHNREFNGRVMAATDPASLGKVLSDERSRFVILEANWDTPVKRSQVIAITDPIAEFGGTSVRVLKGEFRSSRELLQNPGFLFNARGWTLAKGAVAASNAVVVSVESPAFQVIPVAGGCRYFNAVRARCDDPLAIARMQVNWLDANSQFISTSLQSFACTQAWSEHRQEIVAPEAATTAVVFAASDTRSHAEVGFVSFRLGWD